MPSTAAPAALADGRARAVSNLMSARASNGTTGRLGLRWPGEQREEPARDSEFVEQARFTLNRVAKVV